MRHHQQQQQEHTNPMQGLHVLLWGMVTIGSMVNLLWTKPGTSGERHMGFHVLLGFLFIPLYAGLFFPYHDATLILYFWMFMLFYLLWHRIRGIVLQYRGYRPHSQSCGERRLAGVVGPLHGLILETVVTIGAGMVVAMFNEPAGCYLALAGFCNGVARAWVRESERVQITIMHDAQLHAEYMMERFRNSQER